MATSSFFEPLVIRTDEEAQALIDAYEDSFDREPIERIDIHEILKRGEGSIKERYSAKKDP